MKHSGERLGTRRALIASAVWLATGGAALQAFAIPEVTLGPRSLAGQLLVAVSAMQDPRFARTVILLARHSKGGALGIVINRPIGSRPLAEMLQAFGQDATGVTGTVPLYLGGPVEPDAAFVVHSHEYRREGTFDIDGRVAMTAARQVIVDIGHGAGPAKYLIAFGYAGWSAGQLEGELAQHAWLTTPEEPRLVFDADRTALWAIASDRASGQP